VIDESQQGVGSGQFTFALSTKFFTESNPAKYETV
jgi:hypothetical protein